VLNLRRSWRLRLYLLMLTVFLLVAGVVKVLAGVSFGIAIIAATGGLFANGLLSYLGERCSERKKPNPKA